MSGATPLDTVHKSTSPNAIVEAQPQLQKRGRGRPKKGEERVKPQASGSPAVKRTRGRPKKALSCESKETVAAAEAVSEEGTPVKRKRGRPKKVVTTPTEAHPTTVAAENGEKPAAKRKRGRPHKIPAAATKASEITTETSSAMEESGGSEGAATTQASQSTAEEPPALPSQVAEAPSGVEMEDSEQDVMGKLQVSFSESESEGSDPIDATIDALTHRVAPPPKPTPQQNNSPLFLDNQFEESFDEDSDN